MWNSGQGYERRMVSFYHPEYNRSVPGALKNALDVASRPYGQSAWNGKPGAVISASPSAIGGFGANHHLRQSLVFLNVPAMQQPEAYIGGADKLFDASGKLATTEHVSSCNSSSRPSQTGSPSIQNHEDRQGGVVRLRRPSARRAARGEGYAHIILGATRKADPTENLCPARASRHHHSRRETIPVR